MERPAAMAGLLALLALAGPPRSRTTRGARLGSTSAPASRPRPAGLFELPIDTESDPEVLVDFRVRQEPVERIALGVHVYGTIEETPRYRLVDGSGNVQFSDFDLTVFHLGLDFRYVFSDEPVSRSSRSAAAMSRARPKATTAVRLAGGSIGGARASRCRCPAPCGRHAGPLHRRLREMAGAPVLRVGGRDYGPASRASRASSPTGGAADAGRRDASRVTSITTRRAGTPAMARGSPSSPAGTIWGSTFLVIAIGNDTLPPMWAAALRLFFAAIVLAVITRLIGHSFPPGALRAAVFLGVFQFGLDFPLLYWSGNHISSGLSAVMYATVPLSSALVTRAFQDGATEPAQDPRRSARGRRRDRAERRRRRGRGSHLAGAIVVFSAATLAGFGASSTTRPAAVGVGGHRGRARGRTADLPAQEPAAWRALDPPTDGGVVVRARLPDAGGSAARSRCSPGCSTTGR